MKRIILPLLFSLYCLAAIEFLVAAEFRVDNELRTGGRDVSIRSTTYFLPDGFLGRIGENGEITFFDASNEILILADPVLRMQTRLAGPEMKNKIELWRRKHESNPEPLVAFVAKPTFQSESDSASGALALQSPWINYRIVTEAYDDPEIMRRYSDYCDWICYLNFRIDPSRPTPLVRLEVNRILRERKSFPKSMTVSFFPKGQGFLAKEEKALSSHTLVRRLDEADRQRIGQAREFLKAFTVVPFDEYQEKVARKAAETK